MGLNHDIIYTPSLGLRITLFDREREHGRFKGSIEGAKRRSKEAPGEHREGEHRDASKASNSAAGAVQCTLPHYTAKTVQCAPAALLEALNARKKHRGGGENGSLTWLPAQPCPTAFIICSSFHHFLFTLSSFPALLKPLGLQ